MKVIKKVREMQSISDALHKESKRIAIVPTMGYLHPGHASLIRKAKDLADVVVTTLFVNPTQFAPNEDYNKYPRDFEHDSIIASDNGADFLFNPSVEEMYPLGYITAIGMGGFTKKFEGVTRPSHFSGVATVVAKLFNAVKPDVAIFGQKDYQQTLVIKQLVTDILFGIDIVVAPTVRENDGLAMSSRNVYLNNEERASAIVISQALKETINAIEAGENRRKLINAHLHNVLRSNPMLRIDYACSADADTLDEPDDFLPGQHIVLLVAAYLGKTRLIDNALATIPSDPKVKPHFFVEGL